MGDVVQRMLEDMVPELQDYKKRSLFSPEEVRAIVKKRTSFEYALTRQVPLLTDFLRYLQYEMNLDVLRRKRKYRLNQHLRRNGPSDYAIIRRIHHLFERSLRKFSNDINLWLQFIDWCVALGSNRSLAKLFPRALQHHPLVPGIWLKAALYEFNTTGNIDAARVYFQRGLRMNPTSELLWQEFFRMELKYVGRIVKRKAVLGFVPTVEQLASYKKKLMSQNSGSPDIELDKSFDISDLLPLDPSSRIMFSGVIPRAIFQNALKTPALGKNIDFVLSFLPLVPEWRGGKEATIPLQALEAVHKDPNASKKAREEAALNSIHIDEECLAASGVDCNSLYTSVLNTLREKFPTSERAWGAYARAGLVLYNAPMPFLPEIETEEEEPPMKKACRGSVSKEKEIDTSKGYLYTRLEGISNADAVAVARFEEAILALPTSEMWTLFARFVSERLGEYSQMASSAVGDAQNATSEMVFALQSILISIATRSLALGKCTPEVFSLWLKTSIQSGSTINTFSLNDLPSTEFTENRNVDSDSDDDEVKSTSDFNGDGTLKSVEIDNRFSSSIDTILTAMVESGVLSIRARTSSFASAQASLWKQVIQLFEARHSSAFLSGKKEQIEAAETELENVSKRAITLVAIAEALPLWEKLLALVQARSLSLLSSASGSASRELAAFKLVDKTYREALTFFHAARPQAILLSKTQVIPGGDMSIDSIIRSQNVNTMTRTDIVSSSIATLKESYLSWASATSVIPVSGVEATNARILLLQAVVDTVAKTNDTSAIPHSADMFVMILQAEMGLCAIVAETGDQKAAKAAFARVKGKFELAVNAIGTSSLALWVSFLKFLLPSDVSSSNGLMKNVSNILLDGSEQLAEMNALHWRAIHTLDASLKSSFVSAYERMTQRQQ